MDLQPAYYAHLQNDSSIKNKLPDLVCFSHLRWDFVFQRPQHLLTRFAKHQRLFFIEEPFYEDIEQGYLCAKHHSDTKVTVITPHLNRHHSELVNHQHLNSLIKEEFERNNIKEYIFWYYTPMALPFTTGFKPLIKIFDCMDELSAFAGAPKELLDFEQQLLRDSDIVFTGGRSLYEAKKDKHHNVYCFPSSIDKHHFEKSKEIFEEPADQSNISSPKVGYYGVIDERMDLELLDGISKARPDWNFVMLGPVVKIDPATLPKNPNIHYLGQKKYDELPEYLSGWDAAMMPFARNESTKFISPTKIPEYLAAGKPVVSTSIKDVVDPYGNNGLVNIADTPKDFIKAIENAFEQKESLDWINNVEACLADNSWDNTWSRMNDIICEVLYSCVAVKQSSAPGVLSV